MLEVKGKNQILKIKYKTFDSINKKELNRNELKIYFINLNLNLVKFKGNKMIFSF